MVDLGSAAGFFNKYLDKSTKIWYYYPMKISSEKIKKLCMKKNLPLIRLLEKSGVSKNAYYSLIKKDSILPRSIILLAKELGVNPLTLLESEDKRVKKIYAIFKTVNKIVKENRGVSPDNIRHTLILLQEQPLDRLRRALIRAQKPDL